MHPSVYDLWAAYLGTLGESPENTTHEFQSWAFSDNEDESNLLAAFTVQGVKHAITHASWYLEAQGLRVPQRGDLSVITAWTGESVCVIETIDVEVLPFDQVGADYAALEGITDGSLNAWRNAYWNYFVHQFEPLGQSPDITMPVV